jgi:hypothetical protein
MLATGLGSVCRTLGNRLACRALLLLRRPEELPSSGLCVMEIGVRLPFFTNIPAVPSWRAWCIPGAVEPRADGRRYPGPLSSSLGSQTLPAIFDRDFLADKDEDIVTAKGSTRGTNARLRCRRPQCALRLLEQPPRRSNVARTTERAKTGALDEIAKLSLPTPNLTSQLSARRRKSPLACGFGER